MTAAGVACCKRRQNPRNPVPFIRLHKEMEDLLTGNGRVSGAAIMPLHIHVLIGCGF